MEARVELVINTVRIVLVNPRCLCILVLVLFAFGCSREATTKVCTGGERVGRHFRDPIHLLAHLSAYFLFGSGGSPIIVVVGD